MPDLRIQEAYRNGLRTVEHTERNIPTCITYKNRKPSSNGALKPTEGLSTLPSSLLTAMSGAGVSASHPFPQLLRGKETTYLCDETAIYTVNESTWALTQLSPVSITDKTTSTAIPSGGVWHMADFGQLVLLTNGSCIVVHIKYLSATYIHTSIYPETVCNFRGRAVFGGFTQGTSTTGDDWEQFWEYLTRDHATVDFGELGEAAVWWSSIGGADMLQFFDPDTVLNGGYVNAGQTGTESVQDGDFASGTNWSTSGGFSIGSGVATHSPGSAGTVSQLPANQSQAIEGLKFYRVSLNVSNRTAGTCSVLLGSTSGRTLSTNGTHTQYIYTDTIGAGYITVSCTSAFDGSVDNLSVVEITDPLIDELYLRNEQGHKHLPWQGQVQCVKPLDGGVVAYAEDGVGYFYPSGHVLGFRSLLNEGIASRGAVGGDLSEHLLVDRQGVLYRITEESVERLGYEEYLLPLVTGGNLTIHFDPNRREFYISGSSGGTPTTYIYANNALGSWVNGVVTIVQLEGKSRYLVENGSDDEMLLETDVIDFGERGTKNVSQVEAAIDGASVNLTINTRQNKTGDYTAVGPVEVSRTGKMTKAASGNDIRFKLQADDTANVGVIDYLLIRFSLNGKKALKQILSLG